MTKNYDLTKGGVKYDANKLRWDLVPPDAMQLVVAVLTYGAAKYADRNWEVGMDHSRLVGACERHMQAVKMGELLDPDTGLPHVGHAVCSLMFLLAYQLRGIGNNDLPNLRGLTADTVASFMAELDKAIQGLGKNKVAEAIKAAEAIGPVMPPVVSSADRPEYQALIQKVREYNEDRYRQMLYGTGLEPTIMGLAGPFNAAPVQLELFDDGA